MKTYFWTEPGACSRGKRRDSHQTQALPIASCTASDTFLPLGVPIC